jgi:hypothetical protein
MWRYRSRHWTNAGDVDEAAWGELGGTDPEAERRGRRVGDESSGGAERGPGIDPDCTGARGSMAEAVSEQPPISKPANEVSPRLWAGRRTRPQPECQCLRAIPRLHRARAQQGPQRQGHLPGPGRRPRLHRLLPERQTLCPPVAWPPWAPGLRHQYVSPSQHVSTPPLTRVGPGLSRCPRVGILSPALTRPLPRRARIAVYSSIRDRLLAPISCFLAVRYGQFTEC